jgi:DNA repair photolyase
MFYGRGGTVRWDNLRLLDPSATAGNDGSAPLPLFEQGAVIRTFDTPEFRGVTFYEIHAKSIINRVPEISRVPFRWTINPYRGCTHACTYCAAGDTPVLMADGRTKPIAELRMGERIYGTVREGRYRRYLTTEVLAHWQTVKPAFRVTLEDGSELVASGDHRFLTRRGWKHVTGTVAGRGRRPHLTLGSELLGTGAFAQAPAGDHEYRRGYLCGMVRGDAHIATHTYFRRNGDYGIVHQFRLALKNLEALRRAKDYLARSAVDTAEFTFQRAVGDRREMAAIRTQTRANVERIEQIIAWPSRPSASWRKGFLAGIFDAEGTCSGGVLRVPNTDRAIIEQCTACLRSLGFSYAMEPVADRRKPLLSVRLRGGLRERLRFFNTVDPAITRKRQIPEGTALKSDARLRVVGIQPLGLDMPMYDITTGTGDFIANGVVSHNCFARNTHTYLDMDFGRDFDSKVVVKINAPALLRKELSSARWTREHIAMGTNVDPYQRAEGRYKLMRGIIEALRDAENPFSILTKGSLILRDVDLLRECAERTDVGANVSVGSIDRELWRSVEPGTPSPQKRLEVCAKLTEAGVGCGVLMAPILPYLSDSPERLEATVKAIAEAGARHVTPIVLHLRPGAREWYLAWLSREHPELIPKYRELYGRGAYARKDYQRAITTLVHELATRHGVGRAHPGQARKVEPHAEPDPAGPAAPEELPSEQLSLM